MPLQTFTIEQANSALPLVRQIVQDIQEQYKHIDATQTEQKKPIEPGDAQIDEAVEQIGLYVKELQAIGCQIKDFGTGLIDFPAQVDGRELLLCWQPGEEDIRFWHDHDAGFDGRRPIKTLFSNSANGSA